MLLAVVIALVLTALLFDFINGFHDAANSIATVVSTRVLSPLVAVGWAAFFNFVAAVPILWGAEPRVAATMGNGIVQFPSLQARGPGFVLVFIRLWSTSSLGRYWLVVLHQTINEDINEAVLHTD